MSKMNFRNLSQGPSLLISSKPTIVRYRGTGLFLGLVEDFVLVRNKFDEHEHVTRIRLIAQGYTQVE